MLNELNKNHMGGIDNFGAEDIYNMEDVWNERGYEAKLPKKVMQLRVKLNFRYYKINLNFRDHLVPSTTTACQTFMTVGDLNGMATTTMRTTATIPVVVTVVMVAEDRTTTQTFNCQTQFSVGREKISLDFSRRYMRLIYTAKTVQTEYVCSKFLLQFSVTH